MELFELRYAQRSRRPRKRRGRGSASGLGKTAGRGQKGQKARSGGGVRIGFEGGQMPLMRRLPKVGFFTPPHRRVFSIVNLERLVAFPEGTEVTPELLVEKRILRTIGDGVKVLGKGSLATKLTVVAHAFSRKARAAIEAAGGSCRLVSSGKKT